ncbi:Craniofacial development protein 1 [Paragonimus heterotremus]|uniref:Craniofacial development protein 1 n=1 Tax=Paragonimus heterotremus TaxID=100268 RepID=A0A8J4T3B6_9TREM|nr:Craniofacial development protein 1 [Paragonimus heterotremus]
MDSDLSDSSTSDEEYIPPTKLSKTEHSSSYSSDSDCAAADNSCSDTESASGCSKSEAVRKAKEDAIWSDFLNTVDKPENNKNAPNLVDVTRKYQFAGEQVEVIERVAVADTQDKPTADVKKKTELTKPQPVSRLQTAVMTGTSKGSSKNAIGLKSSLGVALQNLKSLGGNKTPKLSTLDKSRLDWQTFVQIENIEDDLKAHNKGKEGYLERLAFVDRTAEREYEYQHSLTNRKL